jgi:hypothetical protein
MEAFKEENKPWWCDIIAFLTSLITQSKRSKIPRNFMNDFNFFLFLDLANSFLFYLHFSDDAFLYPLMSDADNIFKNYLQYFFRYIEWEFKNFLWYLSVYFCDFKFCNLFLFFLLFRLSLLLDFFLRSFLHRHTNNFFLEFLSRSNDIQAQNTTSQNHFGWVLNNHFRKKTFQRHLFINFYFDPIPVNNEHKLNNFNKEIYFQIVKSLSTATKTSAVAFAVFNDINSLTNWENKKKWKKLHIKKSWVEERRSNEIVQTE